MKVNINIQLDDSLNKLKEITSNSVDLMIADPHDNLNKDCGNDLDSKIWTNISILYKNGRKRLLEF